MNHRFFACIVLLPSLLLVSCAAHKNPPSGPDNPALRMIGVKAALAAYKQPDLDVALVHDRLGAFENRFKCFTCPKWMPGYQLYRAEYDPVSGYKAVMYEPLTSGTARPWVLAFSGTDSFQHWLSDLHFAKDQIRASETLRRMFTDPGFRGRDGRPLHRQDLLIAGHSLGGGLSEASAYLIKEERIARSNPAKVMVTSFNGFGASPVLRQWVGKKRDWNPWTAQAADYAANYFHPRDLASEIGDHYGPTYPLGELPRFFSFRIPYHLMENLAALDEGYAGKAIAPGTIVDGSWLAPFLWVPALVDIPLTQASRFFANTGGMPNARLLCQAIQRRHQLGLSPENLRIYEGFLRFTGQRLLDHNILFLSGEKRALGSALSELPAP